MTTARTARKYTFGSFELTPGNGRLLESGREVPISARALDLLAALIESDGLASKKDLLQAGWPGLVVEENTLQAQISSLRKLLGSNAILTVSGRGYRFALAVESVAADLPPPALNDNLPRPETSFIGRIREGIEIKRLLGRSRLLTLVGSGGCGKTRLAIQVATESRSNARHIWFVELAAVTDATLVASRVAAAMGVVDEQGRQIEDGIVQSCASRPALVILDNAEHLLTSCAEFVDNLLTRSANVSFLVTSRERLGVSGELLYRVPSLSLPDPGQAPTPATLADSESVNLFVDRVRLLRPHFAVDPSSATLVATICRRLDGIPLAIELVAPRVRTMSLTEIGQRLDRRFSQLTNGASGHLPRQRTVRAMIDWSYELLAPAEQATLRRASVFSGGWDLASAETVCAGDGVAASDVLDILVSLNDKHLLATSEQHGMVRYRMLETVRQYAAERLDETPAEARRG